MTKVFSTILALGLFVSTLLASGSARAQEVVWVQLAALPGLAAATQTAQSYASRLEDVNGFALGNGWYAVAVGPYTRSDAQQVLRSYRNDRLIPQDSYIQASIAYQQQFWPVGANVLNRGVLSAPTATATAAAEEETSQVAEIVTPAEPDETPAQARQSERALSADERKALQIALQWAGYYNSAIDGAFGRGTRASMSAWQEANGFDATGVLTTLQRAALIKQYNAVLDGLGLAVVRDETAGIEMVLPTAEVSFSKYEPPFAHYDSTGDIGAKVLLISQAGDQSTLFGLYEIMQTLEVVPLDGPRERKDDSFELIGENAQIISQTQVTLVDGQIKGFTLIWPAGDEERRRRVMAEMSKSFTRLDGVLDAAAGSTEGQSIDLVSGLQIRQPKISRSGFFLNNNGIVATTSETVGTCERLTVDGDVEAEVLVNDTAKGLALLRPREVLAPLAVAKLNLSDPRLQSEVSVAGYSYEGVLSAATLTFGKLADIRGLNGEEAVSRLDMNAQPGDAGGPVFDTTGRVMGMLLPTPEDGPQLPGDVRFALDSAAILDVAQTVGVALFAEKPVGNVAPRDLRLAAQGMTVLVSCW